MVTLIQLAVSAVLAILGVMELFRGGRTAPADGSVFWDEDCACCGAGCGECDDRNTCLICGH